MQAVFPRKTPSGTVPALPWKIRGGEGGRGLRRGQYHTSVESVKSVDTPVPIRGQTYGFVIWVRFLHLQCPLIFNSLPLCDLTFKYLGSFRRNMCRAVCGILPVSSPGPITRYQPRITFPDIWVRFAESGFHGGRVWQTRLP